MNLRNVNPYVESAFADWQKAHRLLPSTGREAAPLPLAGAQPPLAGTSSFGMSGVNAHALFEMPTPSTDQEHGAGLPTVQRQRHWALAPVYHLAARALPSSGGRCSFLTDLAAPELAYLRDHQASRGVAKRACALDATCVHGR